MRKTLVLICCLLVSSLALAQQRKTGLWELTTTTTWQKSPFPASSAANSPLADGTHTTQACFTQQMMDKYGAIVPQSHGDCHIINLVRKSNSMTADMVCTGRMSFKANLQSSWSDGEHATGSAHFVGSMQIGSDTKPMEWTTHTIGVYKSSDCGSVQPYPLPKD